MWQFLRDDAMGYAKVSENGNLKSFFQGIAALQTAFLDSCLLRNDGEGNSCGVTLWVIQRSAQAGVHTPPYLDSRSEPAPYPDTGAGTTGLRSPRPKLHKGPRKHVPYYDTGQESRATHPEQM